jgi:adenosylmethionine-8-amino-7-oxononanoate aminotransferase
VVDKIKAKYDGFMAAEYNVESALSNLGQVSEKIKQLEIANTYNSVLYLAHYMSHLDQLETMRNVGDISEMSVLEVVTLMPGTEALASINQEIGNISPEDYNEDGVYTRLCTQFAWGSRYNPPFTHSSDALNAVVATMAKLGK